MSNLINIKILKKIKLKRAKKKTKERNLFAYNSDTKSKSEYKWLADIISG